MWPVRLIAYCWPVYHSQPLEQLQDSMLLLSLVEASFSGLQSPNAVEGLVKLLRRMTSGRRWVDIGGHRLHAVHIYILALQFTGSATPPTST